MKKLLMAVLMMTGVAQAGIAPYPPTSGPPCHPIECPETLTLFIAPVLNPAEVAITVGELTIGEAVAEAGVGQIGLLTYEEPTQLDYGFRIYEEGAAIVGSSFWDSANIYEVGCIKLVTFGAEQTVIPEPATLGLMVVAAGSALFIRRMSRR